MEECKQEHNSFMKSLHKRLGTYAMAIDLIELGVEYTPQYNPYEEKLQNANTFSILDKEPEATSEWGDQYVNAEIFFLRRDRMARG